MRTRRWVSGALKAAGLLLLLAVIGHDARAGAGAPTPLGRPPGNPVVPEVDPGSVLSAFTLLAGGLMVVTDRRRAK